MQVRHLVQQQQAESVLMAYGISAAGKTYTIEGTRSEPGLLPRALDLLFQVQFGPNHRDIQRIAGFAMQSAVLSAGNLTLKTSTCLLRQAFDLSAKSQVGRTVNGWSNFSSLSFCASPCRDKHKSALCCRS